MSELSQILGGPHCEVAPGYVLSPPGLTETGIMEDAFARWHVRRARRICRGWLPPQQIEYIAAAANMVAEGYFNAAMPGYNATLNSSRGIRLTFWLMLRIKRPGITRAEANEILRADEPRAIRMAFEVLGILPMEGAAPDTADVKKKRKRRSPKAGANGCPSPSRSGGSPSTPPSGSDSPPPRSDGSPSPSSTPNSTAPAAASVP